MRSPLGNNSNRMHGFQAALVTKRHREIDKFTIQERIPEGWTNHSNIYSTCSVLQHIMLFCFLYIRYANQCHSFHMKLYIFLNPDLFGQVSLYSFAEIVRSLIRSACRRIVLRQGCITRGLQAGCGHPERVKLISGPWSKLKYTRSIS